MKRTSLEAVARALNQASVPFIVVGGLAVNAHGFARYTVDVDLVIRLDAGAIQRTFAALASLGYRPRVPVTAEQFADPAHRAGWMSEKGMTVLNFYSDAHRETPVDIFVSEPFDFADEYRQSMVEEIAPGVPLRIVRLATLVRLKRLAGRRLNLADLDELRLLHGDLGDG